MRLRRENGIENWGNRSTIACRDDEPTLATGTNGPLTGQMSFYIELMTVRTLEAYAHKNCQIGGPEGNINDCTADNWVRKAIESVRHTLLVADVSECDRL